MFTTNATTEGLTMHTVLSATALHPPLFPPTFSIWNWLNLQMQNPWIRRVNYIFNPVLALVRLTTSKVIWEQIKWMDLWLMWPFGNTRNLRVRKLRDGTQPCLSLGGTRIFSSPPFLATNVLLLWLMVLFSFLSGIAQKVGDDLLVNNLQKKKDKK